MKKGVKWEDLFYLLSIIIGIGIGIFFSSKTISTNPQVSFIITLLIVALIYIFFVVMVIKYLKDKNATKKRKIK